MNWSRRNIASKSARISYPGIKYKASRIIDYSNGFAWGTKELMNEEFIESHSEPIRSGTMKRLLASIPIPNKNEDATIINY